MRTSRYGKDSVIKTIVICTLFIATGIWLGSAGGAVISVVAIVFFLFTLFFYRDPERIPPGDPGSIVAPADGKVLLVRQVEHPRTGEPSTLVSIFMSPFNVHVNRIPVSGKVSHLAYHPGKFLMAFDDRSMSDNERMEIGIESRFGSIWFCQVSGFLARRIVCRLEQGDSVTTGDRFGMIKFGSRVDLILPSGLKSCVAVGQKTVAGETVIARPKGM